VVKVQDDRPHCVVSPGAPDISLCLFECGTARAVVRVISQIVYPKTFSPKLPVLVHIELGIFSFLSLPLVLRTP
jgi:hypothetical protein